MNFIGVCKRFVQRPATLAATVAASLATSVLVACGGGGSPATPGPVVEAVVLSVTTVEVLEGQGGLQNMVLTVTLDKPLVAAATVSYSTASTAKAGTTHADKAAGFATGGSACGGEVDYIQASTTNPVRITIAAGTQVATVPIALICGDTVFEPNETFQVNWTVGTRTGSVIATIVNDDAGGLNSPGVATVLGGGAAFGRDTSTLTNSNTDGALGFSFVNTVAGGCRVDQVTGLTWGTVDSGAYNQAAVAAQVTAANVGTGLCGFTDWRVPGAEELASLVDASKPVAPVNADVNVATSMAGKYWSNDLRIGTVNDQMVVDFTNLGAVDSLIKTNTAAVRLVRGSGVGDPCLGALHYVDHADGTVSDTRTGLMWKQCPEGLSGTTCATGTAFATSVLGNTDAATQATSVNADATGRGLGYADWRVPSRNELSSLVCRSAVAAPLISTVFPATGAFSYVSSTPHAAPGATWFVNFDVDGSVGATSNAGKRLRLVRAGQ